MPARLCLRKKHQAGQVDLGAGGKDELFVPRLLPGTYTITVAGWKPVHLEMNHSSYMAFEVITQTPGMEDTMERLCFDWGESAHGGVTLSATILKTWVVEPGATFVPWSVKVGTVLRLSEEILSHPEPTNACRTVVDLVTVRMCSINPMCNEVIEIDD
jgi:hypothetical protein